MKPLKPGIAINPIRTQPTTPKNEASGSGQVGPRVAINPMPIQKKPPEQTQVPRVAVNPIPSWLNKGSVGATGSKPPVQPQIDDQRFVAPSVGGGRVAINPMPIKKLTEE